jgi:hypothetical protein
VAEKGLDLADVVAGLEEVGGEGVAEGVAGDALGDGGAACGGDDGAVEGGGVGVPSGGAAGLVAAEDGGGEDELPGEFVTGTGALVAEGVGDGGVAAAAGDVAAPLGLDGVDLGVEALMEGGGEHDDAVLIALGGADDNLRPAEVDIPDAEGAGLADAHAGAVEQLDHEA